MNNADTSPEGVLQMLEEHTKCQDPVYYYQRHISGKPVVPESRKVIRSMAQMLRVLRELKVRNKTLTNP